MNRPEINIYIETSIKGPKVQMGAYLYLVESIGDGQTQKAFCFQMGTENQMVLQALIRALERIEEPAYIQVFSGCGHILHSLQNHWPKQWEKNGWKNAKGKDIKNTELWKRVIQCLDEHIYTVTDAGHSYQIWMQSTLRKIVEEKKKNVMQ